MCLYANSHRDTNKRSEPFTIEDFTGQPHLAHNGHNPAEVQHAVAQAIEVLKTSDNITARKLDPEDPRAKVDREQLEQFLRDQGLA